MAADAPQAAPRGIKIRPARPGEGQVLYDVTQAAITGLAAAHYTPAQIAQWMSGRDAAHYEQVIAGGAVRVAVRAGLVCGFVDTAPGVLTRLFVRPDMAGQGLGRRLLQIGLTNAAQDAAQNGVEYGVEYGVVRLEATLNAAPFYARHGFVEQNRAMYRHPLGGLPVEVVHMVFHTAK
ncbi:GNAT family N-acetyltransferase [Acidocella sp.]|uniref:GNAT family N-acetyltransferase n=1 Tax=Acidocella sp. TaxID=50710 RepID=UPI0026078AEC|nr:GNAT family N-acetyltransferase [Acidocella sp.]